MVRLRHLFQDPPVLLGRLRQPARLLVGFSQLEQGHRVVGSQLQGGQIIVDGLFPVSKLPPGGGQIRQHGIVPRICFCGALRITDRLFVPFDFQIAPGQFRQDGRIIRLLRKNRPVLRNRLARHAGAEIEGGEHPAHIGILRVHRDRPLEVFDLNLLVPGTPGVSQPILRGDLYPDRNGRNRIALIDDFYEEAAGRFLRGSLAAAQNRLVHKIDPLEQFSEIVLLAESFDIHGNPAAEEDVG